MEERQHIWDFKVANFLSESSITRINLWDDLLSRENTVVGIWYTLYFIYTKEWEINASLLESVFPKKLKGIAQRDSRLCLRTLGFCFHFCHCPTKRHFILLYHVFIMKTTVSPSLVKRSEIFWLFYYYNKHFDSGVPKSLQRVREPSFQISSIMSQ